MAKIAKITFDGILVRLFDENGELVAHSMAASGKSGYHINLSR